MFTGVCRHTQLTLLFSEGHLGIHRLPSGGLLFYQGCFLFNIALNFLAVLQIIGYARQMKSSLINCQPLKTPWFCVAENHFWEQNRGAESTQKCRWVTVHDGVRKMFLFVLWFLLLLFSLAVYPLWIDFRWLNFSSYVLYSLLASNEACLFHSSWPGVRKQREEKRREGLWPQYLFWGKTSRPAPQKWLSFLQVDLTC